ncbi:hypothetical protein ACK1X7_18480 [Streptomyces sp. CY1]
MEIPDRFITLQQAAGVERGKLPDLEGDEHAVRWQRPSNPRLQ